MNELSKKFNFFTLIKFKILLACFFTMLNAYALENLNDEELAEVSGQDGISLMLNDFTLSGNHTVAYKPDSTGTVGLALDNITIDNGTANTGVNIGSFANPITIDVDSNDGVVIALPADGSGTMNDIHLHVDDIRGFGAVTGGNVFSGGFSLGSLDLTGLDLEGTSIGLFAESYSARAEYSESVSYNCGFFSCSTRLELRRPELFNQTLAIAASIKAKIATLDIDSAQGGVGVTGLHLTSSMSGDPRTPGAWVSSGAWQFSTTANPLRVDIGTGYIVDADNRGKYDSAGNLIGSFGPGFVLSMQTDKASAQKGYIRVEDIVWKGSPNFNGNTNVSLGPVAIDGLKLWRFSMKVAN